MSQANFGTLKAGSLEQFTGGSTRRVMLACDWFRKAVVERVGNERIPEEDYWTHVRKPGFDFRRDGIPDHADATRRRYLSLH